MYMHSNRTLINKINDLLREREQTKMALVLVLRRFLWIQPSNNIKSTWLKSITYNKITKLNIII